MNSAPSICVPVRESSLSQLLPAIERASQRADFVEVRLDYLPSNDIAAGAQAALNWRGRIPLILTLRPRNEGGHSDLTLIERRAFWSTLKSERVYFDWELDLVESNAQEGQPLDWSRIICSYHNFEGIPDDLDATLRRALSTPAKTLKFALATREVTESLALWRMIAICGSADRKLIVVGMNEAGIITRILGPAWGSSLTYAAIDQDQATAPGQLTIDDLLDRYRIRSINKDTAILGIIGWPVSHSLSPVIHNAALATTGKNAVFLPLPVKNCAEFLKLMLNPRTREWPLNWRGVSVTAPHKLSVMDYVDQVDLLTDEIGAVNTIVVGEDGLTGYNTDAEGFLAPLRQRFIDLRKMRCAVIGAGGAARAVVCGLREMGAKVRSFVRDPDSALIFEHDLQARVEPLDGASFSGFELVVNATPLGTRGELEGRSPVSAAQLKGVRLVYDLVYNPAQTAFLREGELAGCSTIGGLKMLVAQAAAQYKLWFGEEAPIEVMMDAANAELEGRTGLG